MGDFISKGNFRKVYTIDGDDTKVVKKAIDRQGVVKNFIECKVFEFCEFLGIRLVPTIYSHTDDYSELTVEKVEEYTGDTDVTKLLLFPEEFHDYPGELYKLVENWSKLAILGIMINPYYNYNYGVDKDGNVLISDSSQLVYLLNFDELKQKIQQR